MAYSSALTTSVQNHKLRLLNALRTSSRPVMTFLGLPSARTAQLVASTHPDGIIIDCEHGHISDDAMHNSIMAISSAGVSPLVRVRMTHADLIKRALDAGAHGIVVPMINTVEDARSVVENAKFPPQGLRGRGSQFPGFWLGVDIPTYIKTANETLLTCVQIETKLGVENVDAICAIFVLASYLYRKRLRRLSNNDIDMLFMGPNDLALSVLGYVPAKGDEPEFVQAIDKIVSAARKHDKWVGRLSNNSIAARNHLNVFDTVAMSYNVRAIINWYTDELKAARLSQR
jgi:4-hydroxy-2-oxoheptanedioate aldolase